MTRSVIPSVLAGMERGSNSRISTSPSYGTHRTGSISPCLCNSKLRCLWNDRAHGPAPRLGITTTGKKGSTVGLDPIEVPPAYVDVAGVREQSASWETISTDVQVA